MRPEEKFASETIERPDGAQVHLYSCEAAGPAKAIIHINHGMCEHAARYEPFMRFLSEHGYHSAAQDHRGHGRTTAPDAAQGMFARREGWGKVIGDAKAVNERASEKFGDLPIVVFGHSMGATVALDYALTHPGTINAAVIWNGAMTGFLPNVLASLLKVERALKGSDVISGWAPPLTFDAWNREFKPNRTRSDWLSRDPAEVDKYVADPDCGFDATIGMWLDLLSGLATTADTSRFQKIPKEMPFHVLNGDKDPCSGKGSAARQLTNRLEKTGFGDVTTLILENTRHESLNEVNRDTTMQTLVDWLDARFTKP